MTERESTFVSIVVYCDDIACEHLAMLRDIDAAMNENFENAEVVCVIDGCAPEATRTLEKTASELTIPTTLIKMSKKHGLEAAMNAGIDMAVGDYVFEIDGLGSFDSSFLLRAFDASRAGGYDIVSSVAKRSSLRGSIFYPLFNRFSEVEGKLETGDARLVSRRALNRVHSMSSFMPYRKAAYAASGLKSCSLPASEISQGSARRSSLGLAVDSLALYTNLFYKTSAFVSGAMAFISLLELIYVVIVLIQGHAVEGWVTTMFVLTLGFLGLFVILTFLMKYVELLVKSSFNKQDYLIEDIEKIESSQ